MARVKERGVVYVTPDVSAAEDGHLWCFIEHNTNYTIRQSLTVFSDLWFVYRFGVGVGECLVCGGVCRGDVGDALFSNMILVVEEGGS